MGSLNKKLVNEAGAHVKCLLKGLSHAALKYHNLEHTRRVVKVCKKMALHYNLNKKDRTILLVAAWFHDVGYLFGGAYKHEERSAEIVGHFLQKRKIGSHDVEKIRKVILSSQPDSNPASLLEEIFHDADSAHLSSGSFRKMNKNLMREIAELKKTKPDKKDWIEKTITFFNAHKYYTDFAQKTMDEGKKRNLEKLNKRLEKFTISAAFAEGIS